MEAINKRRLKDSLIVVSIIMGINKVKDLNIVRIYVWCDWLNIRFYKNICRDLKAKKRRLEKCQKY